MHQYIYVLPGLSELRQQDRFPRLPLVIDGQVTVLSTAGLILTRFFITN